MRIRTKLLSLVLLVAGGFALLAGLSVQTYLKLSSIRGAIEGGQRLVSQTQRAQGLLKDLVFDLFGPRLYSSLQGVVMAPGSQATERAWLDAVADFRSSYEAYMADPSVKALLDDLELKEAYAVAGTMSERAFKDLDGLAATIEHVRLAYPDSEDLYSRIQLSKDESLYAVFDKLRSSSLYLGNIFESYLNRFVSGLDRQSKATERRVILAYLLASLLVIGSGVALGGVAITCGASGGRGDPGHGKAPRQGEKRRRAPGRPGRGPGPGARRQTPLPPCDLRRVRGREGGPRRSRARAFSRLDGLGRKESSGPRLQRDPFLPSPGRGRVYAFAPRPRDTGLLDRACRAGASRRGGDG